jgi:hypothetical protein
LDREQAARAAQAAKHAHDVPTDWHVSAVERRFIEVAGADPDVPAPVRDVLAWIVRFKDGIAWVDLAVDDRNGEIVRVKWSR